MARRENQGIHIALILCVILCVLFMVLTYFNWSRASDLQNQYTQLQNDKSAADREKNEAVRDGGELKRLIGYPTETDVETITKNFDNDMLTYAQSLPEADHSYRNLPAHLLKVNQNNYQTIAQQQQRIQALTAELAATQKSLEEARDQALLAAAQSEKKARDYKNEKDTSFAKLSQEKSVLLAEKNEERSKRQEEKTRFDEDRREAEQKLKQKDDIILARETEIRDLTQLTFETPDGRIEKVNPTDKTALINLGKADGLRPQVTFSVFGVDVNNLAKESPKGSVEVTRVIRDHLSEVRITEDDVNDPILSKDVIYSPVWDANDALRFALLGKMDIDGDGRDDRKTVRSMILMNNGRIDAEDVDGEMKGRITKNTRYIVLGQSSSDLVDSDLIDDPTRNEMLNQAKALGVEEIQLDRILKYMGYNGERRIIPLGKRARSEDFRAKPDDASARQSNRPIRRQ